MDVDITSPKDHAGKAAPTNIYLEPSARESLELAKSLHQTMSNLTSHLPLVLLNLS